MTYTLIKDQEQVKFQGMLNALPCLKSYLQYFKDAQERIHLSLPCHGCDQEFLCLEIKRVVERRLNDAIAGRETIYKGGDLCTRNY